MTKTYIRYRARVMVLAVFIIFSWAGLCSRLFQVQVLNGEYYQRAVLKQSQKKQVIPANRGNIYDRDNRPLTRKPIIPTEEEMKKNSRSKSAKLRAAEKGK